jgi:hypothetical protein
VLINKTGNNIQILNFFTVAPTITNLTIGLSLKNIINPLQAYTDTLSLSLFSNLGVLLGSTTIDMTISPGVMICSGVPSNKQIEANTSYTFTITPNINIPLSSTGSLIVTFPSGWSDSDKSPIFS